MSVVKKELNEYLFYELGLDTAGQDHSAISEDLPFLLTDVGTIEACGKRWQLFRFTDHDQDFFVLANGYTTFFPAAGMDAADIAMQLEGSHWIADQEPIDLDTICGTESDVPRIAERRARVNALARSVTNGADAIVLEGLYLARRREYLVLAQPASEERAHVIGDRITLRNVPYPLASPSRRLSLGIGKLIRAGMLR